MESYVSDCHVIKTVNPMRKSGFYWIKPRCAPKPLRVFCDFSIEGKGVSILLFNNNQAPNTILETLQIDDIKDVRYQCANIGYEPINLKSKDMMLRLMYLLKTNGWDMGKPLAIPLGWDYGCPNNMCKEEYFSFASEESNEISDLFLAKTEDKIDKQNKNTIGLGYGVNGEPYHFNIKEADITALFCSTNNYGKKEEEGALSISCSDSIISNSNLNSGLNSSIRVHCPSFCKEAGAPIFGSSIYSQDSSICRAALHSGKIKDIEGGVVALIIRGRGSNLKGSKSNGIKSLDFDGVSELTITVGKNDDHCPVYFSQNPKLNKKKETPIILPQLKNKSEPKPPRVLINRVNTSIGVNQYQTADHHHPHDGANLLRFVSRGNRKGKELEKL